MSLVLGWGIPGIRISFLIFHEERRDPVSTAGLVSHGKKALEHFPILKDPM
jgi:hypothetical protein